MAVEATLDLSYFISLLVPTLLWTVALNISLKVLREPPAPVKAFFTALAANLVIPIAAREIGSLFIPFGADLLAILIWTAMVRLVFAVDWKHALWIGALGYLINQAFLFLGLDDLVRIFVEQAAA